MPPSEIITRGNRFSVFEKFNLGLTGTALPFIQAVPLTFEISCLLDFVMLASSQNLGLYSMRQSSLSAAHALQVCVPVFPERVKLRQPVKNGSLDFGDPPKMV